ncbi:MAG: dihydrolipoyl dehydrogenase [Bacteroidales bacterium]|nr:dihydrolipoyl dehydrogenase [Bacteroidales bacterium]
MIHFDLIVVGGGPGGYEIAAEAAKAGRKVALFEKGQLGGTCLNRGCIPTKCLLASAGRILHLKSDAAFGIDVPEFKLNYGAAVERTQGVVTQLRSGIDQLLRDVTVIPHEAVLHPAPSEVCGPDTCEETRLPYIIADGEEYAGEQIIIATGSKPATLPIPGADLTINSDQFLALTELPKSVAVIGGGVIGMEFASIMAAFGVEVTVIEYCKEILPPFDQEVAKRLRTTLSRRGIKIVVGAQVKEISRDGEALAVTYAGKKGDERVVADTVLMAVGRKPVVPQGCEESDIHVTERGFIEVDSEMRTSAPGVYAVGDCNGRCMLAHAAAAQARIAMGDDVDIDYIPSAVFTIPECAMVGLTEEQCKREDIHYAVGKSMFAANGKALSMGEGEGFVKVIYSPATRLLQGVHIIGPHAADLIAEATACMAQGATVDEIATSIIHGHPTLSEALAAACASCACA